MSKKALKHWLLWGYFSEQRLHTGLALRAELAKFKTVFNILKNIIFCLMATSPTHPAPGEERLASHCSDFTCDSTRSRQLFNTCSGSRILTHWLGKLRIHSGALKHRQFVLFIWRLDSSTCSSRGKRAMGLKLCFAKAVSGNNTFPTDSGLKENTSWWNRAFWNGRGKGQASSESEKPCSISKIVGTSIRKQMKNR